MDVFWKYMEIERPEGGFSVFEGGISTHQNLILIFYSAKTFLGIIKFNIFWCSPNISYFCQKKLCKILSNQYLSLCSITEKTP